jgi:hypothetical protein
MKDVVCVSSFPVNIPELECSANEIVATVTTDVLAKVWEEMEYQIDGSLWFMRPISSAPIVPTGN